MHQSLVVFLKSMLYVDIKAGKLYPAGFLSDTRSLLDIMDKSTYD